jgi:hypothetical protein
LDLGPRPLGRRIVLASAGSLFAPAIGRAQGANSGAALVIGNSKYQWEASLPNVRRDAPDVTRTFQGLGLKTELVQDAGRDAMLAALARFGAAVGGARQAVLYFAGHGAIWENRTYVVPMDADLSDPSGVRTLIPVHDIIASMDRASCRLLALDSCRNNPADGWRQRRAEEKARRHQSEGADRERDPPNTMMLFSTTPGRVALDGPAGDNSPFAAAFMHQLEAPSIDLQGLPAKLRRDLLIATDGRQVLWDRSNYDQPFVLAGTKGARVGSGSRQDPSRLIELGNAYAFAQQSGLPMPPGLVACRTPGAARDGQIAGSFKYMGANNDPAVLVVLAASADQGAEAVLSARDNKGNASWRFLHGALPGGELELDHPDGNERLMFKWSDANAGKVTILPGGNKTHGSRVISGAFTRLDG